MAGDGILVDGLGVEFAFGGEAGEFTRGVGDFSAAAITEAEDELALVGGGGALHARQRRVDLRWQILAPPHDAQADAVLVEHGLLVGEVVHEQMHERRHLVLGAFPVLDGEGVKREVTDVGIAAVAKDAPHGLAAGTVSLGAGKAAGLRPAAVAVHDDGEVAHRQIPTRRVDSRAGPMERMPKRPPESWMSRST